MKQYTFNVTGASPYDGEIIIIAFTWKVARRLVTDAINSYNASAPNYNDIKLTGEERCEPFKPPQIVHFESGEA